MNEFDIMNEDVVNENYRPDLLYLARQINQANIRLNKLFGVNNWRFHHYYFQTFSGLIEFTQSQLNPDCRKFCPYIFEEFEFNKDIQNIISKDFFLTQIPDPKVRQFIYWYT